MGACLSLVPGANVVDEEMLNSINELTESSVAELPNAFKVSSILWWNNKY